MKRGRQTTANAETGRHNVMDTLSLKGRVALVTGASGYLGGALVEALAEAGSGVVVSSRKSTAAKEAAKHLPRTNGQKHHAVELDHMDEVSIADGMKKAVAAAGRLDILVCNGHEFVTADWTDITANQFSRQLMNATGYFLMARHMRDHVTQRGGTGSIVFLGSMYGLVGSYPDVYKDITIASPVAYHALKGGIIHMTRHLAVYWAKDGIRVNTLSPGPFPAPNVSSKMVKRLEHKSPLGRMGKPHELKGALLLLASDAGSYITGQNLVVDGGWTAW